MIAIVEKSAPVVAPTGRDLLNATGGTLLLAVLEMFATPVEGAWQDIITRLNAAEESCRRRLPIGGADYLDEFGAELRELLCLAPRPVRPYLYSALAMLPALRASMRDTPDTISAERALT